MSREDILSFIGTADNEAWSCRVRIGLRQWYLKITESKSNHIINGLNGLNPSEPYELWCRRLNPSDLVYVWVISTHL